MKTQLNSSTPYSSIIPKKGMTADIRPGLFTTSEYADVKVVKVEVNDNNAAAVYLKIDPHWAFGSESLRETAKLLNKLAKALERTEKAESL